MAQVDFSNALLEPRSGQKPITESYNLYLNNTSYLFDSNGANVVTSPSKSTLVSTPSKVTILYSGTFSASGTEFYMCNSSDKQWKVSNISFNPGDTYSFAIDIETSITT